MNPYLLAKLAILAACKIPVYYPKDPYYIYQFEKRIKKGGKSPEKRFAPIEHQTKKDFRFSNCIYKRGPFMRQAGKDYFNNGLARII
jgi:hypothetical protein